MRMYKMGGKTVMMWRCRIYNQERRQASVAAPSALIFNAYGYAKAERGVHRLAELVLGFK